MVERRRWRVKPGLEAITGCMFCGKTDELIRRLKRADSVGLQVQVFKPRIDDRFEMNDVASHSGGRFTATPVDTMDDIREKLGDETDVVAIDEAQFFGDDIIGFAEEQANKGMRVIVAGLDTDFRAEPFGPTPQLMAVADRLDKLSAICNVCGNDAHFTQRLIEGKPAHYDEPVIKVGAGELYEARCREHHEVPR